MSSADTCENVESNASSEVLLASVSLESFPPGRKNDSNAAIAPADFAKSLACKTCVVERHAGPRTCRTMRCHVAVFPEPGGPEINRWGGFAWSATRSMVSMVDSSSARSQKRRGGWVSSQLAMRIIQRQRSLTICVNSLCLECLLLPVSAASA